MIKWLYYALRRWFYRNVYLRSDHWQTFRLKALKAVNWECQHAECKVVGWGHIVQRSRWYDLPIKGKLQVHHKHYRSLWRESIKDVVVLCGYHHAQVELGYEIPLKNGAILPGYKKPEIIFL